MSDNTGRKPFTFMERDLFKIARKILPGARFGIDDDLMELGLADEGIRSMASQARDKGIDITAEDILTHRTILNIVRAKVQICHWVKPFDPNKPVLVLAYGVARLKFFAPYMSELEERFSILTIEPIVEHWNYIFKNDHIEQVIDLYEDLVRYRLPEDAKPYAFMGYSFGGDIAYRLALRWLAKDGCRTIVYLLDTWKRVYDSSRYDEFKEHMLAQLSGKERMEAQIFMKMGGFCFDIPKMLGDGREVPPYPGPVRLFSATQVKEEPTLARVLPVKAVMREDNPNVQAWEQFLPELTVDFVDADHLTLMLVPEFHDIFFGRIDSDLEDREKSQ